MKKRMSIISPFKDVGGRELETGFIAQSLNDSNYCSQIISTTNFTLDSQIFDFNIKGSIVSINLLICKKYLWFRILAWFSYLKSNRKYQLHNYTSNSLARKFGYNKYALKILKGIVSESDVVVLCMQIGSAYAKEIVEYAHSIHTPVVMRTTSKIPDLDKSQELWLEKVSLFIHHSEINASRLASLSTHNYAIIDQCVYQEEMMLQIEPVKKCKSLLYIGRLSSEKGILELVNYFKKINYPLSLTIIGYGPLYNQINEISNTMDNLDVLGHINQIDLINYIQASDALIIPSYEEAGPLVGLEAMASARLIISTSTGAMPERLRNASNQFWFDITDIESLKVVFNKINLLSSDQIKNIAVENRTIYLQDYKSEVISDLYRKTIFSLLKDELEIKKNKNMIYDAD